MGQDPGISYEILDCQIKKSPWKKIGKTKSISSMECNVHVGLAVDELAMN